jgi:hypothetical protein
MQRDCINRHFAELVACRIPIARAETRPDVFAGNRDDAVAVGLGADSLGDKLVANDVQPRPNVLGVFFWACRYTALMRRFLRYLRIAFSITCGIVCVLLIVLWVRSYRGRLQRRRYGRCQGLRHLAQTRRLCRYTLDQWRRQR